MYNDAAAKNTYLRVIHLTSNLLCKKCLLLFSLLQLPDALLLLHPLFYQILLYPPDKNKQP